MKRFVQVTTPRQEVNKKTFKDNPAKARTQMEDELTVVYSMPTRRVVRAIAKRLRGCWDVYHPHGKWKVAQRAPPALCSKLYTEKAKDLEDMNKPART